MTIRQIAEAAGVSAATVSLALRNDSRIAAETRALVCEAAHRLNYRKRPRGRPPRGDRSHQVSNRSNRVAVLTLGMRPDILNAPVYMSVVHGVESALASHRKLCLLRHFPTDAAPSRSLFPQKVDGVLIFGSVEEEVDCPELKELPCVQMMGTMRGLPWDHVTYDNEVVGKLAAEYLLSRGHRTVAMLAPDDIPKRNPGSSTLHGRRDSFCRTMAAANAHVNLVWGPFADTHLQPDRQTLEQVIDALLAAQPVPTGLFCPYDLWTACLYPLLYARGIQPGRDLDIVSCNNEVVFLQNLFPRPATVDIHAYDVGRRAVEQLLWRIEHQSAPRNTIAIQPSVVVAEK